MARRALLAATASLALAALAAPPAVAAGPASSATAAPTSAPTADPAAADARARSEIDALLQRLKDSGCRFERNGDWHDGAAAQAHLQRKLKAAGAVQIPDAESFIDRAASRSSFTGRAYQVQCGSAPAVPAQRWLLQELARLRAVAPR